MKGLLLTLASVVFSVATLASDPKVGCSLKEKTFKASSFAAADVDLLIDATYDQAERKANRKGFRCGSQYLWSGYKLFGKNHVTVEAKCAREICSQESED